MDVEGGRRGRVHLRRAAGRGGGAQRRGDQGLQPLQVPGCLARPEAAEPRARGRAEDGSGQAWVVGEGYGHGGGGGGSLQRCLDQRGPDDGRGGRGGRGGRLDAVRTVCHLAVVLHNLLDDLVLLVVEDAGVEIVLDFVEEDGVLLAWATDREQGLRPGQSRGAAGPPPSALLPGPSPMRSRRSSATVSKALRIMGYSSSTSLKLSTLSEYRRQ